MPDKPDRPLRIVHLLAATGMGGAERVVLNYCIRADRQRYEPIVCCIVNSSRPTNAFTEACIDNNVRVEFVKISSVFTLPHAVYQVFKSLRERKRSMLHSHGYLSDAVGVVAAFFARVSSLSTVHGWTGIRGRLKYYEEFDRKILRLFTKVHCVSAPLYGEFVASGFVSTKLVCLPNGFTVFPESNVTSDALRSELGLPALSQVILAVGRLSQEKGHRYLVDAFAKIQSSINAVLLMVGDGPERYSLECQVANLGLSGRVFFTGHRNDLGNMYRLCDFFVLPSLTEGTPMVLLEAMGMGLPIVATHVGGIPDCITQDREGLLVQPKSSDAISDALLVLICNREIALKLGRAAQKRVLAEYDPDSWARKIEQLYDSVSAESLMRKRLLRCRRSR